MNNQTYINRLKKNLCHPRAKMHWKIVGVMAIFLGTLLAGTELWREFQSDKINKLIKTEYLPALSSKEKISTEDLSSFHSLIIAQAKMNHSSSGSMIGGMFIGLGVVMFLGIFTKPKEIILSLWERVEILEKQLELHGSNKIATQNLEPIVTTPVDEVEAQSTQAHV